MNAVKPVPERGISVAAHKRFERANPLWCIALLAAVVAAHAVPFFGYHPGDADHYVIRWYRHIVEVGRMAAFSHPFSNYTPTYLYLLSGASLLDPWLDPLVIIKLLSCAGAAWLAYAVARLLNALGAAHAIEIAIASLLLPSVILNVSVLGQADTFWVAPCVLALVAALEDRMPFVALWSGIAFAFKAQAIFFAPFVLLLFVRLGTLQQVFRVGR